MKGKKKKHKKNKGKNLMKKNIVRKNKIKYQDTASAMVCVDCRKTNRSCCYLSL